MTITASLVKELREKTGAGMMDCKKALTETGGDLEGAVDWLRTKGLAAAAKKAGRVAAEGLIGVAVEGDTGAIVEVNAETDFVARNETFQNFVRVVASLALQTGGDLDALKAADFPGEGRTVEEQLTHLISTIGENMSLRRVAVRKVESGVLSYYLHNATASGLGKIAVLVGLEGGGASQDLGKKIAMHVAATCPLAVSQADLDPAEVDRERQILSDQARESGKPEGIIDKMVDGRIRKFFEDVCLLDQTFVVDGENKVGKVIENAANAAGGAIFVSGFDRFGLGEGIQKKEEDFAAEVAAATGG